MHINEKSREELARELYRTSCNFHGLPIDWSRTGYKTSIMYWQALADTVIWLHRPEYKYDVYKTEYNDRFTYR
tara:strand:- start:2944 stop:3162 length:219 start_codon:yes stop_codon:yes gene_type:complete